ncbi:MAG: hypothetical protein QX203_11555 [Methylococcaceae bacterium]
MSLMALFSSYAEKSVIDKGVINQLGNRGNQSSYPLVTSTGHATPSGNRGNQGNHANNTLKLKNEKLTELLEVEKSKFFELELTKVTGALVTTLAFNYRTTEKPAALLTMVTQGKTLEEAIYILDNRYGDRLLSVEQMELKP